MSRGMSPNRNRAITLLELLIALVLLCLIVLGISNIEVFCRYVFVGADRKSKVLNEAVYAVEHMNKFIGQAVGDANNTPVTINSPPSYCTRAVQVRIDNISKAPNGVWDLDDSQIMYCFNNTAHTMTYYLNYTSPASPGPSEDLSRNVDDFIANVTGNTVNVNITSCWNASITAGPGACGSVDNPRVSFQTRIFMASVSVNATP